MFIEVRPRGYDTEEQAGTATRPSEWLMDVGRPDPPRKPAGFAVERLAGAKRLREAYQTATDTWVGAD